jgi:hypothetical protein
MMKVQFQEFQEWGGKHVKLDVKRSRVGRKLTVHRNGSGSTCKG